MGKKKESSEEVEMTLEEGFFRIEEIAEALSEGELSLEDSFKIYHEGMELLKKCNEKIDTVEKKVQILREDGSLDEF